MSPSRISLRRCLLALALALASSATAQQFNGTYIPPPSSNVLSDKCGKALNTTVQCPSQWHYIAWSGRPLSGELAPNLCISSCLASLQSARSTISSACTTSDYLVIDSASYPATFLADQYIVAYNTSCLVDSNGDFCDPQIASWSTGKTMNDTKSCSDCWLRSQRNNLNNPLSYDANAAGLFASLTKACNATTGYEVTSQTVYANNATTTVATSTSTWASPPRCTGSYNIKNTDTCNSIAQALGVSTYNLVTYNGLDLYCNNLNASVGLALCQPPQCPLYTWQAQDTCSSVARQFGNMTVPQFVSWNPMLTELCDNALSFVGYQMCIANPGGMSNATTTATAAPGGGAANPKPAPTNSVNGTTDRCGNWYTIQSGDTCATVSAANNLALSDFYFLNPEINNPNCTNLWLGNSYCVQPVGSISTYPGYTVSSTRQLFTVTSATFAAVNTDVPTTSSNPGYAATTSLLPTASGTLPNCATYKNFDVNGTASSFCSDVAHNYLITLGELKSWNPSLSGNSSTCTIAQGYSYCVVQTANRPSIPPNYCLSVNATMNTTISSCNCFTLVQGWLKGDYRCVDLLSDYSITSNQLLTWNPWIGSGDCDTGLYAGMNSTDARSICIGVPGQGQGANVSSSAAPISTASSQTISKSATPVSTASQGPSQSGEVAGCTKRYTVQSGDSCDAIDKTYGITFQQFYSWNPSIGSNCQYLQVGASYCVAAPTSSSTGSASATTQPQGPTQSGEVSGCTKRYTVQSGDSCDAIDKTYGITFQQFYSWNPSIGSNCQYLKVGASYCVAAPSSTSTGAASPTTQTQGPTVSGEVANCLQHYTVQSGDSCSAIDTTYNITFQQFYNWNPSVGNNCQYLQVGRSYCVKA